MRFSRLDALLLLMAVIWGTNYAIIKTTFREIDPQAFNALRMIEASCVMAAVSAAIGRRRRSRAAVGGPWGELANVFYTSEPATPADWRRQVWLGFVGHAVYQFLFIGGLARTSVANSSLLIALTPVAITLLSAVFGRERLGRLHWGGTLLSLAGVYIVVGRGARLGGSSVTGDLMILGAVVCWALYTIGARPLMERHSPVGVTGLSMLLGTVMYVPFCAPALAHVPWQSVSVLTWIKLMYSALFALCLAYTIWYTAVRAIGGARTSVYSNLLPIVAMLTAYFWLHEPIGRAKLSGAAAILLGVAAARMAQGSGLTAQPGARETIDVQ